MEWLSLLLTAVLFAAACNLDTVILSMGYAVKGVRVSLSHSLIIAALTTLITWASLLLGAGAARVLRGPLPNLLGGLVLAGIGAWFVLDWLRRLGPAGEAEGENRAATLWGCVSLAAALAVNNAGIGVAAGVSGIAPGWAALANFLVTLAALPLGRALGDKLAGGCWANTPSPSPARCWCCWASGRRWDRPCLKIVNTPNRRAFCPLDGPIFP